LPSVESTEVFMTTSKPHSPGSELAHLRWDPLSLAERRLQMADMWAGAAEKRRASKAKPAAKAEEAK